MSNINGKSGRYSDSYSRNQCSLMIRVDDESIEVPVNFGMTADEIKRLYPYLLQYASMPIKNPVVAFNETAKSGVFNDVTDEDYEKMIARMNEQSRFWFDKSDASLLDIAIRFALDIKLRGIAELADIFEPVSVIESVKVEPITDDEAEKIISEMGLETETDKEFDAGDEQDIPLGIAGGLDVNLYDSTEEDDYLSQELDAMEAKLEVHDKFEEILQSDVGDLSDIDTFVEERYQSIKKKPEDIGSGSLKLYDEEEKGVFDELYAQDDSYNIPEDDTSIEAQSDDLELSDEVNFEEDNGSDEDNEYDFNAAFDELDDEEDDED